MTERAATIRRRRRLLATCSALLLALAVALAFGLGGRGVQRAAGLTGAGELVAQTDDSAPVTNMTLFGASAAEAAGEVWGIAKHAGQAVLIRYAEGGGWSFGPGLQSESGEPLKGFSLDTPEAFRSHVPEGTQATPSGPSPLAAQITPDGAGAMLGEVGSGSAARQVVLVRRPGGAFKEEVVPKGEEGLKEGEQLYSNTLPPVVAALEEGEGAGAFVVPTGAKGVDGAVLHWNGSGWTRETIEVPAAGEKQFEVLAIGAVSAKNAWLLGRLGGSGLALFRRAGGSTPSWRPVSWKAGGEAGEAIEFAGEPLEEPSAVQSQLLSVTSSGVWVDGRLHGSHAATTLFFSPQGEAAAGSFTGGWCEIPASTTSPPPQVTAACSGAHLLPAPLPTDFSRSFAWAGPGAGERVITGLADGQLLRLTSSGEFKLVNTLGGVAGGVFGAAFSSSTEGWLGKAVMPVHVTTASHLAPDRLAPWPVPFRFALTALAPQPGAPIGAVSSEVLAVGDRGEVARYHPDQGWFPETLPGPGGKRETPRLRAVAWPTPERAFAVGDSKSGAGEMWLWRGETGLWEKDPATPLNFRGNLLGVAFDPNNSARGYAVGQQGVLLSYGKSWTQEPEELIPPAARGASFTSIAFAGSEAIVAWRKLIEPGQNRYRGGILVNSGSGWKEDEGAAAVLGTNAVPWAVAALPDGGAAFTAQSPTEGAFVYERSAPGAPWQASIYPGGFAPGALTLFREDGALRAIGTGAEPETFTAEEETAPPPGFPPILVDPYPLASSTTSGVLRQTASGWSDEEHELNDATSPPGGYRFWDTPNVPDPANAVMVDPSGGQGWAVGGVVNNAHALLDTADIYRYPADGEKPPGEKSLPETTGSGMTSIAIGGGAGCAAPCATRADTGIGPTVWLQNAVKEAAETGSIGAFVYTGPGVTTGALAGPPLIPVPWAQEEQYYAARTFSSTPLLCVAPSATDREGSGEGSEAAHEASFAGEAGGSSTAKCRAEASGASYAFDQGSVRVIVLDTSLVQGHQLALASGELEFLTGQLKKAQGRAIVVGSADLPREYAEGHVAARELVAAIQGGSAAGYFFDSPEENVREPLGGAGKTEAYGSGTLGYVNVENEETGGFIGQSGFLVVEIPNTPTSPGYYKPRVKLVPNIAELAVEAQQGTLLRRSQAASFVGLARRPRSGNRAPNRSLTLETAPYVQIPSNCVGSNCGLGIKPEYEFHSSNTEYGEFVKRNFASAEPNAVEHDSHGNRISQEKEGGKDGLFCALNATPPGHPVDITLKVANLSFSLPVTIQAGSVRQPCGTTTLSNKPHNNGVVAPPPPVAEREPPQNGAPPTAVVPVPPAPAAATTPPPPVTPHTPLPQFLPQPSPPAFLPAFVPVPLPTPARPTPPSGTSPVTSPVEAAQKEEEEEAAPESVDAAATAYHPSEHEAPPVYLLGLIVLAAFAGASLRGRRRPRRERRVAPATVTTMRAQQRWERGESRRWG